LYFFVVVFINVRTGGIPIVEAPKEKINMKRGQNEDYNSRKRSQTAAKDIYICIDRSTGSGT